MAEGVPKDYLVTLSSAKPAWKSSKWQVHAESKTEALQFAMLMHDDRFKWPVVMVTISNKGVNPHANLDDFEVVEPKYVERLLRIYEHGKEKLYDC